ncbi:Hypothetical predicted protein [Podarcis lilfordi]|uniref:Uncharacterized protein n=1 Tax=Podarcis lilfordi TaxID=74358 RepID=A0AA35KSE8_9SAUR|nr:Hypothetical predicted protein [Podarcis lilfordi]
MGGSRGGVELVEAFREETVLGGTTAEDRQARITQTVLLFAGSALLTGKRLAPL